MSMQSRSRSRRPPTASDAVNHPTHYTAGTIEVIDAIEDWNLDFHLGNVVKYVARSAHKGKQLEDLRKASWYLQRKINLLAPAAALGAAQVPGEGSLGKK